MNHSSNGKLASGTIYIQTSKSLLERLLRERPSAIHNLDDRGCRVVKIGKSMDKDTRAAQLRGTSYGGASDWVPFSQNGKECCYPFTAALWNEQRLHKFVRGHSKITHLTRDQFPWLYDRDGHTSVEVYFGPPRMIADYIKACFLSTPKEMKSLRDARDELSQAKTMLSFKSTELARAQRHLQISNSDLAGARVRLSDLEDVLRERNGWRKAAMTFLSSSVVLGLWLYARP